MVRIRLFVVASPAGRKEPPHAVGRWPSASDGRWGFARFPQHARLRVSCGPGMPGPYGRWPGVELLPGRADMESAPTEGIGRKGNNNEVPRASNAHPYKASNKIYALFLAIRRNRLCCKLSSAGAACGVDVGGELSACAVHLAELGENLLCAGVVVLGDESL